MFPLWMNIYSPDKAVSRDFLGTLFLEMGTFPHQHTGCMWVRKWWVLKTSDPQKCYSVESYIVPKGVPTTLLIRHPPLDPACPLFKIFVSPSIFSVPSPFKVFYTVSPNLMQPHPALIRPTNLPWFQQISKGWFYQFNCCFLSKINL